MTFKENTAHTLNSCVSVTNLTCACWCCCWLDLKMLPSLSVNKTWPFQSVNKMWPSLSVNKTWPFLSVNKMWPSLIYISEHVPCNSIGVAKAVQY